MGRKILFIANNMSFILRSLSEKLVQTGFECSTCPIDITKINNESKAVNYFFINLDETVLENTEFFIFLRDLCNESNQKILFVGYKEHLDKVSEIVSSSNVAGTFERPINVNEITDAINKLAENAEKPEPQKHILVVDDSGEMLRTVKTWLSSKYKVSMANSAVNAISFLSSNKPDLILLDYEMPICSGPQLLGMIRAEMTTEDIPVIFLTGKSDAESVKAVLSLKPQGYILKSRAKEEILDTISAFFDSQKK